MSAGFNFRGETYWGTNGAIEIYLEALTDESKARFGMANPMMTFFHQEREEFFMGKIVFLDALLPDADSCQRFIQVFDAATDQIMRTDVFSEYGRLWIKETLGLLRQRIVEGA